MVLISLLASNRDIEADARTLAQDAARRRAQELRRRLDDPALLETARPTDRLRFLGVEPQLPPEVGWLHERPREAAPLVMAKLRAAADAEFGANGDAAGARQQFDELLATGDLPVGLRHRALALAAWQAERAGDTARRDERLVECAAATAALVPAAMADPDHQDAVAAEASLRCRLRRELPDGARLLPLLPEPLGAALLERLQEHGADVGTLRERHRSAIEQRAACAVLVAAFGNGGNHASMLADGRVLLRFASREPGYAELAAVTPEELAQHLDRDARGHRFGTEPPGGEVVVPGLWWIAPHAPAPSPLLARPAFALVAVIVLAVVCACSALLGVRALRRQAEAVAVRAEFLTMVTHELKTPLSGIRLIGEMLVERRVPDGKERDYFQLLASESARLSMLIENVLDLGRLERGERVHDPRPGDLRQCVHEAATLFEPLCQRDGLQLERRGGDGPLRMDLDHGALLQALLNVLDNARKYGRGGGRIVLEVRRDGDRALVSVRDCGPGVPEGEREAVFDRFVRGSAQRHGSIPGVGLGLYLARAIARRHGGDLRCGVGADGVGALFTFELPLGGEGAV